MGAYKVQAYPREGGRQEGTSPKVFPPQENPLKTRDLELPFFEGSLPSRSPHSAGYTRTFLLPYFLLADQLPLPGRQDHKTSPTCLQHRINSPIVSNNY